MDYDTVVYSTPNECIRETWELDVPFELFENDSLHDSIIILSGLNKLLTSGTLPISESGLDSRDDLNDRSITNFYYADFVLNISVFGVGRDKGVWYFL